MNRLLRLMACSFGLLTIAACTDTTSPTPTGSLALALDGLPSGATAQVTLTKGAVTKSVTASSTLLGLEVGDWTLKASSVTVGGVEFAPQPLSQTVVVPASAVGSARVVWGPTTGSLAIAVLDLPDGTAGDILVEGPGYSGVVSASTTLTALPPGAFVLTARDVRATSGTYRAAQATQSVSVAASVIATTATVTYAPAPAAVDVTVTGLPANSTASITLTSPTGGNVFVNSNTRLGPVNAGRWRLNASSVQAQGFTYTPVPATRDTTVSAGDTLRLAIGYVRTTGALAIAITGLPGGAAGSVTVTEPSGATRLITATTTLLDLAPGTYVVRADTVIRDGFAWRPLPVTQQVNVTTSLTAAGATVAYAVVSGSMQLTVDGLPSGVNGALTLTGQSQTINLTGSTTVPGLSAGSYTLTALIVTDGNTAYSPDVATRTITIEPSVTRAVTVTYRLTDAPIDLVLEKAYVTQATQNSDGSVALVAGRDALLRVFARSDRSNALSVPVRARIYDGGTLLQTASLDRTASGVPTTPSESSLTSTWNLRIAGVDVRPALRVLVDIDPSNAVVEANETNNSWPADGSPRAINVVAVPAFNVRFVPVTVGNLTGNITTGNMNRFVAFARLVWPLLDINASVRAPFTSSADTLRSNDSNGGWLTVLNEMHALRGTDGAASNLHYYGVVKVAYTSGVAGYGYVPGRAAMGWDYLPSGDPVAAHEWGHNFNLPHAPCGSVSGPDPLFPYTGGRIGVFGWNATSNTIVPTTTFDLMGYCDPEWVSDYNWSRVMTYRQSSGIETAASSVDGLLVWGRVVNGAVQLEPAFRVTAPATAASARPTHRVEALDSDGNVLLDLPITADKVDHVTDHDERQFSVVVPWTAALEQALTRMRVRDVRTPLLTGARASATAVSARLSRGARNAPRLVMPDPEPVLEAAANGRTRVRWNTQQYPMAMVRDAATGDVMGFVRRSGDAIVNGGRTLEVVYSDGVRSVVRR